MNSDRFSSLSHTYRARKKTFLCTQFELSSFLNQSEISFNTLSSIFLTKSLLASPLKNIIQIFRKWDPALGGFDSDRRRKKTLRRRRKYVDSRSIWRIWTRKCIDDRRRKFYWIEKESHEEKKSFRFAFCFSLLFVFRFAFCFMLCYAVLLLLFVFSSSIVCGVSHFREYCVIQYLF